MVKNLKRIKVLEQIFSSAAEGIVICDQSGVIRLVNPRMQQVFGYKKGELLGETLEILIPNDIVDVHRKHRAKYNDNPHPRGMGMGLNLQGKMKNGDLVPLEISLNPFEYKGEHLVAAFIIDISERVRLETEISNHTQNLEKLVVERTQELEHLNLGLQTQVYERKNAERALRKSQKKLELMLDKERELNALKSRFVSMASHEFRTPLSTILSSISLVDRYSEQDHVDKRNKHVERIKNSVKQLTGILEDFLSLGRLEEGKITPQIEDIQIYNFAKIVIDDLGTLVNPDQRIILNCEKDLVCSNDKKMVRQILVNLLSNAIKYSEKGTIEVNITKKSQILTLKVADEGIGIPLEDQKNMFSRFFRAGNSINIEGTGLGLNIVSKHVELLDGKIEFVSEEGVGTTFTVTLKDLK